MGGGGRGRTPPTITEKNILIIMIIKCESVAEIPFRNYRHKSCYLWVLVR